MSCPFINRWSRLSSELSGSEISGRAAGSRRNAACASASMGPHVRRCRFSSVQSKPGPLSATLTGRTWMRFTTSVNGEYRGVLDGWYSRLESKSPISLAVANCSWSPTPCTATTAIRFLPPCDSLMVENLRCQPCRLAVGRQLVKSQALATWAVVSDSDRRLRKRGEAGGAGLVVLIEFLLLPG